MIADLTPGAVAQIGASLPAALKFDTVAAAQAHLTSHGVGHVLAQFVDIHGVAKAKAVPVAHLNSILTDGAGFDG
jgi:glutamine synthetase